MRPLRINLDGRDAHYLLVAMDTLEYSAYKASADSKDDMERWNQIRALNLRIGSALLLQATESLVS